MRTFLGVDGGGTKTDLALVNERGDLLVRLQGETSNQAVVGFDAASRVLQGLIDRALLESGAGGPITAGWIGMAGSDRPEDRAAFTERLGHGFGELQVTNDAELVLSGTPDGTGIALIAGTGSIAFARNTGGDTGRSGGWGHIFGDEGSAFAVVVQGLRAVAAVADGRGPATRLMDDLMSWWNADQPHQLITRVYAPGVKKPDIAAAAPVVVAAAEAGDEVARTILLHAGDDLAALVVSLLDRVAFESPPAIAGTGGLLLRTALVRDRLAVRLDPARVQPEIRLVEDIAVSVANAVRRFHLKGQK